MGCGGSAARGGRGGGEPAPQRRSKQKGRGLRFDAAAPDPAAPRPAPRQKRAPRATPGGPDAAAKAPPPAPSPPEPGDQCAAPEPAPAAAPPPPETGGPAPPAARPPPLNSPQLEFTAPDDDDDDKRRGSGASARSGVSRASQKSSASQHPKSPQRRRQERREQKRLMQETGLTGPKLLHVEEWMMDIHWDDLLDPDEQMEQEQRQVDQEDAKLKDRLNEAGRASMASTANASPVLPPPPSPGPRPLGLQAGQLKQSFAAPVFGTSGSSSSVPTSMRLSRTGVLSENTPYRTPTSEGGASASSGKTPVHRQASGALATLLPGIRGVQRAPHDLAVLDT